MAFQHNFINKNWAINRFYAYDLTQLTGWGVRTHHPLSWNLIPALLNPIATQQFLIIAWAELHSPAYITRDFVLCLCKPLTYLYYALKVIISNVTHPNELSRVSGHHHSRYVRSVLRCMIFLRWQLDEVRRSRMSIAVSPSLVCLDSRYWSVRTVT